MQEFTIDIGTSEDSVNLADGLPLFPKIGAARAGISSSSRSNTLLDCSFSVICMRTKVSAYYDFFMGVLGPAVAFTFPNTQVALDTVSTTSGIVSVDLGTEQQMVAGMAIGFVVGAGMKITQQIYLPSSWRTPWKFEWKTLFELSLKIEIDFIKLLLALIKYLLGESGKDGLLEKDTSDNLQKFLTRANDLKVAESFKFYAYASDNLSASKTSITAVPKFTLPWDFMKSTPAAKAFMDALGALQGELQFGPCFEITMPVTLGLTGFTVRGGQTAGASVTYEPVTYQGSTAIASGPAGFLNVPDRFSTNVAYSSGFGIALSCFFKVGLMKVFSFTFNGPSLDIAKLLSGFSFTPTSATGSVSTEIATGCILTPQMTIQFLSSVVPNYPVPLNTVVSGIPFACTVFLNLPWGGNDTNMSISITPELAGFPTSVPVRRGDSDATFKFTIPNQCVLAGDPNHPNTYISPSATSPYQSFLVTATLPQNPAQPCLDYEVTGPVKVLNRFITISLFEGTPGLAPVWDPDSGATLNANQAYPPEGVANSARIGYSFDFVSGENGSSVPMIITLLDDERVPYSGSDVWITFDSGPSARLSPSAHVSVPLPTSTKGFFTIQWRSAGPAVNYSTLFYLIVDGGCAYGQSELWLDVWNWA